MIDKQQYWDMMIALQERQDELESRLPKVTDSEFDEYTMLMEITACFDTWIDKI